jgi:hypothetical protein
MVGDRREPAAGGVVDVMSSRFRLPLAATVVVVFGDGTVPSILIDCMQFRLVADRAAGGDADESQLMQLHRHVERRGCRECRTYLAGRVAERRLREQRLTAQ